jgi:hypothetical protein
LQYIFGWKPHDEPFRNLETVSPDSIHNSRNCSPKFGAVPYPVTTPASNYFQFVRHWQNPRVQLCLPHRGLRPGAFGSSIGPLIRHQSTIFFLTPANFVPSGEQTPLFPSPFFVFSVARSQPSLSLSPVPSLSPPRAPLLLFPSLSLALPPTQRWGGNIRRPTAMPRPYPAFSPRPAHGRWPSLPPLLPMAAVEEVGDGVFAK